MLQIRFRNDTYVFFFYLEVCIFYVKSYILVMKCILFIIEKIFWDLFSRVLYIYNIRFNEYLSIKIWFTILKLNHNFIMGQFVKILHYFILAFLIFKRIPYGLVITDLFFISVSHVILVGNNVTVPWIMAFVSWIVSRGL